MEKVEENDLQVESISNVAFGVIISSLLVLSEVVCFRSDIVCYERCS